MASGTQLRSAQRKYRENHLTCCICMDRYKNPKILTCQHSFCENCLETYYESRYKDAPKIPCPTCRREIELPEEGIKGLKTNFHLSGIVEEFALQEKVACLDNKGPSCGICDEKEALHRCFDCVQNICEDCLNNHQKFPVLKSHTVHTLADIRQGKVEVKKSLEQDESKCHKHKGELTRFYCESCNEQICNTCTALAHCRPEHRFIDSGAAAVKYKQSLNDQLTVVNRNIEPLQRALADVAESKEEGSSMVHKAKADVQDSAAGIIEKVKDEEKRLLNEIEVRWQGYSASLDERDGTMKSVLQREQYSLQMAEEIMNTASDSDFLSLYPIISGDLEFLNNQHPSDTTASKPTWRLTFDNSLEMADIILGNLKVEQDEKVKKVWELRQEVGHLGSEPVQFEFARGIAHSSKRDEIAVADVSRNRVVVYSTDGLYKRTIPLNFGPWDVVFSNDQMVISDTTAHVRVYNERDTLAVKFSTVHHVSGLDPAVIPLSISIKLDGTIVVGDTARMVLTEHRPSVRTIPLETKPCFIDVEGNDKFAVSDYRTGEVAVVDADGVTLFRIHPSVGGQRVRHCIGVCFCSSGLYVAMRNDDTGSGHIHNYDHDGKFLGCVSDGLFKPEGITITADERQITVADTRSVKFFHVV